MSPAYLATDSRGHVILGHVKSRRAEAKRLAQVEALRLTRLDPWRQWSVTAFVQDDLAHGDRGLHFHSMSKPWPAGLLARLTWPG